MSSMMKDVEAGTRVVGTTVGKNCIGKITEVNIVRYSY